jgi:hypothetical protein
MVRDPATKQYRRTRLFVFTLGYSRESVRLLTFQSSGLRGRDRTPGSDAEGARLMRVCLAVSHGDTP